MLEVRLYPCEPMVLHIEYEHLLPLAFLIALLHAPEYNHLLFIQLAGSAALHTFEHSGIFNAFPLRANQGMDFTVKCNLYSLNIICCLFIEATEYIDPQLPLGICENAG